jgi:small subunit ribosomal protein S16
MVVIRLSRAGAKKTPFYHIVVTDSRRRRDGNYIERVGYFNPVARGEAIGLQIDMDRIDYWQNVGAQLSDRVASLIKNYKKSTAAA